VDGWMDGDSECVCLCCLRITSGLQVETNVMSTRGNKRAKSRKDGQKVEKHATTRRVDGEMDGRRVVLEVKLCDKGRLIC